MNAFGEPNMGNPSVRFDEGRERVGHWPVRLSIQPLPPTRLLWIALPPREDFCLRFLSLGVVWCLPPKHFPQNWSELLRNAQNWSGEWTWNNFLRRGKA